MATEKITTAALVAIGGIEEGSNRVRFGDLVAVEDRGWWFLETNQFGSMAEITAHLRRRGILEDKK